MKAEDCVQKWIDEQNDNLSKTFLGLYFCIIPVDKEKIVYLFSSDVSISLFKISEIEDINSEKIEEIIINKILTLRNDLGILVGL